MPARPMTPALLIQEISDNIEFLGEVIDARQELTKLGKACANLCEQYRAMGVCQLSGSADIESFFDYLIQSALTRRHYLAGLVASGGGDAFHRRASFLDPVFDAIAARQWRLAIELNSLAAQEWSKGEEYEDDFCYAAAIRLFLNGDEPAIEPLLERWKAVLDGGVDRRLDIVTALAGRETTAFAATLGSFLRAEDAKARTEADPVTGTLRADESTFFPNRWVSIEGLALLAIAKRRSMLVVGEFLACPPMVQNIRPTRFQSRGFPNVPYTVE